MSKVFDMPRYTNQALVRLLYITIRSEDYSLRAKLSRFLPSITKYWQLDSYELEDIAEHFDPLYSEWFDPETPDDPNAWALLGSEEARQAFSSKLWDQEPCEFMSRWMLKMFNFHKVQQVINDDRAQFFLISKMLEHRLLGCESEQSTANQAHYFARQFVERELPINNIDPELVRRANQDYFKQPTIKYGRMLAFKNMMDSLCLGMTPRVVTASRMLARGYIPRKGAMRELVESLETKDPQHLFRCFSKSLSGYSFYNLNGVVLCFIRGTGVCLVLDHSAISNVRECVTVACGYEICMNNYEPSYNMDQQETYRIYDHVMGIMMSWCRNTQKCVYVPQFMHKTLQIWINQLSEDESTQHTQWKMRDDALKAEVREIYPHDMSYYQMILNSRIPTCAKAEILKLYHILPPPDGDMVNLMNTIEKNGVSANKYDRQVAEEFYNFTKSFFMSKLVIKEKRKFNVQCQEGYDYKEQEWFKSCMKGKFRMPPRNEWGKVYPLKVIAYETTSLRWQLDANDVTRVECDMELYIRRQPKPKNFRIRSNELMTALLIGDNFSNGMKPKECRDAYFSGRLTEKNFGVAAIKAENTKPPEKSRETISAVDIFREFESEKEKTIQKLASMCNSVALRKGNIDLKRMNYSMSRSGKFDESKMSIKTSQDVTKWSPQAPRDLFLKFQHILTSMTDCPNPDAIYQNWRDFHIVADRRGYKKAVDYPQTMIQGFTGTSDTVLHSMVLNYIIYTAQDKSLVTKHDQVFANTLIDDAVTITSVKCTGNLKAAQAKVRNFISHLVDTYTSLGLEVDKFKSFISHKTHIFLNKIYVDGASLDYYVRILSRADREWKRRFVTIEDHVKCIQNTVSASIENGADPIFAHYYGTFQAYLKITQNCKWFSTMDTSVQSILMYLPETLGGFGYKTMLSLCCTGPKDNLTEAMFVLKKYAMMNEFNSRVVNALLSQELDIPTKFRVFCNPTYLARSGYKDPTGIILKVARKYLNYNNLAEPFKSLGSDVIMENIQASAEKVLDSGMYDAPILEAVASNMPHVILNQMIAKVEKTEALIVLLSSKGITEVRRRLAKQNIRKWEMTQLALSKAHSTKPQELIEQMSAYQYTKRKRDAYLAQIGVTVLNHTMPCEVELMAKKNQGFTDFRESGVLNNMAIILKPRNLVKTHMSRRFNMKDCITKAFPFVGYKSSVDPFSTTARPYLVDPTMRKFVTGVMALAYAKQHDRHYVNLAKLFYKSWLGTANSTLHEVWGASKDIGMMRISPNNISENHSSLVFINSSRAVHFAGKLYDLIVGVEENQHDYMALTCKMRAIGLITLNLMLKLTRGSTFPDYMISYCINESAIAVRDKSPVPESVMPDSEFSRIIGVASSDFPVKFADGLAELLTEDRIREISLQVASSGIQTAQSSVMDNVEQISTFHESQAALLATRRTSQYHTQMEIRQQRVFVSEASTHQRGRDDLTSAPVSTSMAAWVVGNSNDEIACLVVAKLLKKCTSLVLDHPLLAERLRYNLRNPQFERLFEQNYDIIQRYQMSPREIGEISKKICELGELSPRNIAAAFRTLCGEYLNETQGVDINHQFFATKLRSCVKGFLRNVCKAIQWFKAGDSDTYSRIRSLGGNSKDIARFIKAQWKLGGARRYMQKIDSDHWKARCYEIITNAAANALDGDGLFSETTMRNEICAALNQALDEEGSEVVINNVLSVPEIRDILEDDYSGSGLAFESAHSEVMSWVETDIHGEHTYTRLIRQQGIVVRNEAIGQEADLVQEQGGEVINIDRNINPLDDQFDPDEDRESPSAIFTCILYEYNDKLETYDLSHMDLYEEVTESPESWAAFIRDIEWTPDMFVEGHEPLFDNPDWYDPGNDREYAA